MSDAERRFHESGIGMVQPDGLVVSVPVLVGAQCMDRSKGKQLQPVLLDLCPPRVMPQTAPTARAASSISMPCSPSSSADPRPVAPGPGPAHRSRAVRPRRPPNHPSHPGPAQTRRCLTSKRVPTRRPGHWRRQHPGLPRHFRVPIGLLVNDQALRLLYAPHGESSGAMTFAIDHMATVGGREILDALLMLLSAERFFA